MPTHVYADANIFLDFFRFSDDDLGVLQKLESHLQDGNIILHLPQLTAEEYFRNRDKVVLEQLSEIKKHSLKVGIPIFIRDLDASKAFQKTLEKALTSRNELLTEVEALAAARTFRADELISSIFQRAQKIETAPALIERAQQRLSLGNPPGKPGSIGDRLNWESLLEEVPHGNDLCLLTRDSDYLTSFPSLSPSMFIVSEWREKKGGNIHYFKGIKPFAKFVDETIVFEAESISVFSLDPARTEAIEVLILSFSFSETHSAIGLLSQYIDQFSPDELEQLLEIALSNSQVGGIMGDEDVQSFYSKIRSKMPWIGNAVADRFDEDFGAISEIPF